MLSPAEVSAARLLIVDDLRSNVRLLEHTLRRAGFSEVMSTIKPCEVAALHREHRYHLILLDLQMPEMNGFEVMKQLRDNEGANRVAILVLSADSAQKANALEKGADSFLGKPFLLPEVVERVQTLLSAGL